MQTNTTEVKGKKLMAAAVEVNQFMSAHDDMHARVQLQLVACLSGLYILYMNLDEMR